MMTEDKSYLLSGILVDPDVGQLSERRQNLIREDVTVVVRSFRVFFYLEKLQ